MNTKKNLNSTDPSIASFLNPTAILFYSKIIKITKKASKFWLEICQFQLEPQLKSRFQCPLRFHPSKIKMFEDCDVWPTLVKINRQHHK